MMELLHHITKHLKKQSRMKKYNSDNYDSIMVYLDENRTPLVFEEKIKELMEEGVFDNEDDARRWLRTTPIELELYYHKGCGLFGVESDAVEMSVVYDPYDGKEMEECEEWDN